MTIPPALNESFYSLDSEELAFFKANTNITDDNALKKHIMTIQAKAYQVRCYSYNERTHLQWPIIGLPIPVYSELHIHQVRHFIFNLVLSCPPERRRLKVSRLPVYKRVLELSHERKDAIFMDVGCCCKRHNYECGAY